MLEAKLELKYRRIVFVTFMAMLFLTLFFCPKTQSDLGTLHAAEDFLPFNFQERYGFIDRSGNVRILAKFSEVGQFGESVAPAKSEGKWGFINRSGKWTIPPKYDDVKPFNQGIAPFERKDRWGYLNHQGKHIVENKYTYAETAFNDRLLVRRDGNFGFLNTAGETVIALQFKSARSFSNGKAAVRQNGRWGFINRSGTWAIQPNFSNAGFFKHSLAEVKKSGLWGYIDPRGDWQIKPKFDYALSVCESEYAIVQKRDLWGVIDTNGKQVIPFHYKKLACPSEGLVPAKKDDQWGYLNLSGDWRIRPKFSSANSFDSGLASVNHYSAYINQQGRWIFPEKFSFLGSPYLDLTNWGLLITVVSFGVLWIVFGLKQLLAKRGIIFSSKIYLSAFVIFIGLIVFSLYYGFLTSPLHHFPKNIWMYSGFVLTLMIGLVVFFFYIIQDYLIFGLSQNQLQTCIVNSLDEIGISYEEKFAEDTVQLENEQVINYSFQAKGRIAQVSLPETSSSFDREEYVAVFKKYVHGKKIEPLYFPSLLSFMSGCALLGVPIIEVISR